MIKTYTVCYGPNWWECLVAIQDNEETFKNIKGMVEFWEEWAYRLYRNDGDYIKTFLQQLARKINYIQAEHNYNLKGVLAEFDNLEGWSRMDGSAGIEILEVDNFSFDYDNYVVMEDSQ